MKKVIICADDYGMSPKIDSAIRDLITHKKISATSCMSLKPNWADAAKQLLPLTHSAAIGLHFDLDDFSSLGRLIVGSLTGNLDKQQLADTLNRQLDCFEDHMHKAPDYLDGHQHVHVFPIIRDVVSETVESRYGSDKLWIRDPDVKLTGHDAKIKALVIKMLRIGFKASSTKMNTGFAGLYSISETADFAHMMEQWLKALPDGGLIMCHPSIENAQVDHSVARANEYHYLMSDRFQEYLLNKQITLVDSP